MHGELNQVAGKIKTAQSTVKGVKQTRSAEQVILRIGLEDGRHRKQEYHARISCRRGRGKTPRADNGRMGGGERGGEHPSQSMVAQLRLDIDMGEAFVPGVRRGYVIIPYSTGSGESAPPRKIAGGRCLECAKPMCSRG